MSEHTTSKTGRSRKTRTQTADDTPSNIQTLTRLDVLCMELNELKWEIVKSLGDSDIREYYLKTLEEIQEHLQTLRELKQ